MFRLLLALASCLVAASPLRAQPPETPPAYRAVLIEGAATVRALQKQHGVEGFDAILRINRVDLPHVRQGATLNVPAVPTAPADLSPFPSSMPAEAAVSGRFFVVSRRIQAWAAYDNGTRVRWGPVSTGRKETPTPSGLFATNWKSKLRRSSDNREWLLPWYVNFINASGVSFHQFALPGYPASHACVRLLDSDAKWIYEWAESWVLSADQRSVLVHGTPVLVFGDYDYAAPGPWTRLAIDPRATDITIEELTRALEPHRGTLDTWRSVKASSPSVP